MVNSVDSCSQIVVPNRLSFLFKNSVFLAVYTNKYANISNIFLRFKEKKNISIKYARNTPTSIRSTKFQNMKILVVHLCHIHKNN